MSILHKAYFSLFTCIFVLQATDPLVELTWQNNLPIVGENCALTVQIHNVLDLDTYSYEIVYDSTALLLIDATLDAPLAGIKNVLRNKQQALLPVIKTKAGRVQIAATLTGTVTDLSAPKTGCIGVIFFKVLRDPPGTLALENARLLDSKNQEILIVNNRQQP